MNIERLSLYARERFLANLMQIASAADKTHRWSGGPTSAFWTETLDALFWPAVRAGIESAWWKHAPFAHWLVTVHRSCSIVELSTCDVVSYSAICEAVKWMRRISTSGYPAHTCTIITMKCAISAIPAI